MALDAGVARTNARIRTAARIGGVVLTIAGVVLFLWCGKHLLAAMNDDSFDAPNPAGWGFGAVGSFALFGLGLSLLNIGFLRAQVNYLAGEGSQALRSVAGDIGAGLQDQSPAASSAGPYCSRCGVRNDADARFCDACGNPLATA